MVDSALQALVGMAEIRSVLGACPLVPFALDSLRVHAPCRERMLAWVRRAPAAGAGVRVDIDLCDEQGTVCVQMRGFACRELAGRRDEAPSAHDVGFDDAFYETLIERIASEDVSIDAAVQLG
jgi:hypothetical protein